MKVYFVFLFSGVLPCTTYRPWETPPRRESLCLPTQNCELSLHTGNWKACLPTGNCELCLPTGNCDRSKNHCWVNKMFQLHNVLSLIQSISMGHQAQFFVKPQIGFLYSLSIFLKHHLEVYCSLMSVDTDDTDGRGETIHYCCIWERQGHKLLVNT